MTKTIRYDGNDVKAHDFVTDAGQRLSTAGGGGGGSSQSPLQGRSKAIANNTDTDLFSFPLANGEIASIHFRANALAKKGSDWAILGFEIDCCLYNDGGTLVFSIFDTPFLESKKKLGSAVDLAPFSSSLGGSTPTFTLNAGIVTVSVNPGNVGTTPDSITINYSLNNPSGKTILFL